MAHERGKGGRRWRPKLIVPSGIGVGLVALWSLDPYLVPWVGDDPLARAMLAIGLAGVGAVVAYLVMVVVTRTWPGAK